MGITEKQNEIIASFNMLDGDMEMTVSYIMELGDTLPDFPEEKRMEDYIVKGCQSKVWLDAKHKNDGTVSFQADSNTAITKGLLSLLVKVYEGEKPEEILDAEIYFPEKIGMSRFIGTQRSNGFAAMIKQIRLYALAFSTQMN